MLNESIYAKPIYMYHGTSSVLARAILKHGMKADPPKRTWSVDPDTSVHSSSRASLSGSYWTSNLLTAMSAVMRSNQQHSHEGDWRKVPGLIVVAEIVEQSALADEDSIKWAINHAWAVMNKSLGVTPETASAALYIYYGGVRENETRKKSMMELFMKTLHEGLTGSEMQPAPIALLQDTFVAELHRLWAHAAKHSSHGYSPERGIDPHRLPPIPTPDQAEKDLLAVKDRLTRYYRKTAYKKDGAFAHTLRMPTDVGFSGSSKIVALIQYDILNDEKKPLTLLYGKTAPLDFIAQWRDRKGPFPGLNRADGAVMIKPDEKKIIGEGMKIGDLPSKGWFHLRSRDYIPIQHLHYVDLIERPEVYGIEHNPVLVKIKQERPTAMGMADYVYNPDLWTELRGMMFDLGWVRVNGMNHGNVVIDANDMPSVASTIMFLMDHGAMIDGVTYDVRYPNSSGTKNGYIDERHLRVFLRNRGQERRAASPAMAQSGN